jgi:desulfoferrodoxin (superoxide reductase-like protein)
MHQFNRRSFCQAAVASAALITGSLSAAEARMTDIPKNTKYPVDPNNLTSIDELGHVPSIVLEKMDAASVAYGNTPAGVFYKVTVQAKHESILEHHISAISLYVNGKLVGGYNINDEEPEFSMPMMAAVLRLNHGDELLAVTECNKHGLWGNRIKV